MRKQCMKQYLHQKKGGKVTPLNSAKFGQKQRIGNEGWKFQKFVLYTPELSSNFQNSTQQKINAILNVRVGHEMQNSKNWSRPIADEMKLQLKLELEANQDEHEYKAETEHEVEAVN